ncbi:MULTISPECIES: SDR family NAD(P)-dependent oxidoreductase [Bacillaceae]|uniref:SDR family NAD(P)-dependent oxidoreductase n=1 Tax=Ectobacillus funiculus TaxID=137993 RepID=A0ABV5WNS1_9BACI|nr:SDR family NAD(P)-dependent oxidoreductase [Ectobacillus funiculus]
MKLAGKVIIVTGGGIGIGRKTALLLAQQGANVVITDIDVENGKATVEEILAQNGQAIFVSHNVNKTQDWKRVVEEAMKAYGTIDMLFNNAGLYRIRFVTDVAKDQWEDAMAIYLKGLFLEVKHLTSSTDKREESTVNDLPLAGLMREQQQFFETAEPAVSI